MSYVIRVVEDNARNLKLLRDVPNHAGYVEKPVSTRDLGDQIRRLLSGEGGCTQ